MTGLQAESGAAERRNDGTIAAAPAVSPTERVLRILVPVAMLALLLIVWQAYVVVRNLPHYILPSPIRVAEAMATDWPILAAPLVVTQKTTFAALAIALGGAGARVIIMAH